jgi:hypothetical protein
MIYHSYYIYIDKYRKELVIMFNVRTQAQRKLDQVITPKVCDLRFRKLCGCVQCLMLIVIDIFQKISPKITRGKFIFFS